MYNPHDLNNDETLVPHWLFKESPNTDETLKKDKEALVAGYLPKKPAENDIFWTEAAFTIASRIFKLSSTPTDSIRFQIRYEHGMQTWEYKSVQDLADGLLGKGTIRFPLGLMECDYQHEGKTVTCSLLEAIFFSEQFDKATQYEASALVLLDPRTLFYISENTSRAIFDHTQIQKQDKTFLLRLLASGLLYGNAVTVGYIKKWLENPLYRLDWVDQKEPFAEYALRSMFSVPEIFTLEDGIGAAMGESDEWAQTLKAAYNGSSWGNITALLHGPSAEPLSPPMARTMMQSYLGYFMQTPMYAYQLEMFKIHTKNVLIEDVVDMMHTIVVTSKVNIYLTYALCQYMVDRLKNDEHAGDAQAIKKRVESCEKMAEVKLASLKKIDDKEASVDDELSRLRDRPLKNDPYWKKTIHEILWFVFPNGIQETFETLAVELLYHNEKDINNNVLSTTRFSALGCIRGDESRPLIDAILRDEEITLVKRIRFIVFLALHDPTALFYKINDKEVNVFEQLSASGDFDSYPVDFYGDLMLSLMGSDNFHVRKKIIEWFDNSKTIKAKGEAQAELIRSFEKRAEDPDVHDDRCQRVFAAILAFGTDGFKSKLRKELEKNPKWHISTVTSVLLKDLQNIAAIENTDRRFGGYEILWNLMRTVDSVSSYELLFGFRRSENKPEGAKNLSGFVSWLVTTQPWADVQKYFIKMRTEAGIKESPVARISECAGANLKDMHFMMLGHYLKGCLDKRTHMDSYRTNLIAESFIDPEQITEDILRAEKFFHHGDLAAVVFKEYMLKKGKVPLETLAACKHTSREFQRMLQITFVSPLVKSDILKQIRGAIAAGFIPATLLKRCADNKVHDINVVKYFLENADALKLDFFGKNVKTAKDKIAVRDLRSDLLLCLPEGKWTRPKEPSLMQEFYDLVNNHIYDSCTAQALEARPEFVEKFFNDAKKCGTKLDADKFWADFLLDDMFPVSKILGAYEVFPEKLVATIVSSKSFVAKFNASSTDVDFNKLSADQRNGYLFFCGKLKNTKTLAASDNARGIVAACVAEGVFNAKEVASVALAQNKHALFAAIVKYVSYDNLVELTHGKKFSKECTVVVEKRFEEFKCIEQEEKMQAIFTSLEAKCKNALQKNSPELKHKASYAVSMVLFSAKRPPLLNAELDALGELANGCTKVALKNLTTVIAESKEAVRKLK